MEKTTQSAFARLCEIVTRLRAPGGCPWDREQTHESLLPATIEEAYEVAEAARAKNDAHFREELGDLLLLVVMHAEIAREEKRSDSHYLASLPRALPALMRAQKAQSKVARVNFDWTELREVLAKVEEELGELKQAIESEDRQSTEDEIGDLLFAVVNLARKCKLDAETALQAATDKFVSRFNLLEDELRARGKKLGDVDLAELDEIWNEIKQQTPNAQL